MIKALHEPKFKVKFRRILTEQICQTERELCSCFKGGSLMIHCATLDRPRSNRRILERYGLDFSRTNDINQD